MARIHTRTFPDGDYADRLNQLWNAAMAAREDESPQLLSDGDPYLSLFEQYQALKEEAESDARSKGRHVVLRDPGRKRFREMKAKFPPRTDEALSEDVRKADEMVGFNREAAQDDLLYITVAEPEFTSRGAFDEWLDELGEGEFQTLLADAHELVTGARYDPKALPPSRTRSNVES